VFELGHTLFLLEVADLPPDLAPGSLPPDVRPPMLATLHPRLARDVDLLTRVAGSDVPVLLLGETGTGKEIFARAVHQLSGRNGPYVAVNCGGLAPSLVEAELFGHKRGAFSGAVSAGCAGCESTSHRFGGEPRRARSCAQDDRPRSASTRA